MSPILSITFMNTISRCSHGFERIGFGGFRIRSLFFADDEVLLASSSQYLQLSLEQFGAKCEPARMRITSSKFKTMVLSESRVECLLWVRVGFLHQLEELKYL